MPVSPQDVTTGPSGDPALSVQVDTETPKQQQVKEFYEIADGLNCCLLTTHRDKVGLVSRCMAVARRDGPDFLLLANKNSQKFKDLADAKDCQITFQDSSSQQWISVAGTATTTDNDDPRIQELHNLCVGVWFGDLGDGVHDGGKNDPRITLIEVKANHVAYWKRTTFGTLGFLKEVGVAAATGKIADTGLNRELNESDLEAARKA